MDLKISGKNLGQLETKDFCPRCFWLEKRLKTTPFSKGFPGIFNTLDSYTKNAVNGFFVKNQRLPDWLGLGDLKVKKIIKAPHHTKFRMIDPATGVMLTGTPDEVLLLEDGTYYILDYKTAKLTPAQANYRPIYDVQLNSYAFIGEHIFQWKVSGLALVYCSPVTEIDHAGIVDLEGFGMNFKNTLVPIDLRPTQLIPPLLKRVKDILTLPEPPAGVPNCPSCSSLDILKDVFMKKAV